VQLHRYNTDTLELMEKSLARWAAELSTPERPISHHFIRLSINDIQESELRLFLNRMPTSFALSNEQVDKAIEAGHLLLRENSDYRRLLTELGG